MNIRFCNFKITYVLFYFIVSILFIFSDKAKAQTTVFIETFGNMALGVCDLGTLANGFITMDNTWTVLNVGVNDSAANEWYISETEPGLQVNSCAVPGFHINAVYNLGIVTTITASDTDICTNTCIDFFTDPGGPYNWFFNGAIPSTSSQQNPSSICYPNPGTFTVQLINGADTSNISIIVNPCIPPTADFQADVTIFCERSCVNFSDLSINGATGWSWFFPGGTPSSSASPTPPPICYYTPGFYDVRLIVFNQYGTDTLVKTSYMNVVTCPLPVADFNSTTVQTCPQYCLSFTDNSSNGPITSYQWYFPGSLSINSSSANPNVCYSNEGMFDVQLIVSNQYGSDTIIKYSDVNVQFLPNAFINSDTAINFGSSYQLNASGGINYSWAPMSGLDDINIPNPIATPSQTTTYTVSISDGAGCTSFRQVTITVLKDNAIFIPNTFSPNGDGKNDYFFVRGNNFSDVSIFIFDRWGEKIFETTNLLIGWDGTYKGEKVDPGVFTYVITISYSDKKSVSQSGTITLVR